MAIAMQHIVPFFGGEHAALLDSQDCDDLTRASPVRDLALLFVEVTMRRQR